MKYFTQVLILLYFTTLCVTSFTCAETITWNDSRDIDQVVTVGPEDTLVITSGVYSFSSGYLHIKGALVVEPGPEDSVLFTSANTSAVLNHFLLFDTDRLSDSRIRNAEFATLEEENKPEGFVTTTFSCKGLLAIEKTNLRNGWSRAAIQVRSGSISVEDSVFNGSSGAILSRSTGSLKVKNTTFSGQGWAIDTVCEQDDWNRTIIVEGNNFNSSLSIRSVGCGNLRIEDNSATTQQFLLAETDCAVADCHIQVIRNIVKQGTVNVVQREGSYLFVTVQGNNFTSTAPASSVPVLISLQCSQGIFDDNRIVSLIPSLSYTIQQDASSIVTGTFFITNNRFESTDKNLIIASNLGVSVAGIVSTRRLRVKNNSFRGLLKIEVPVGSAPINATENTWLNAGTKYRTRVIDFLQVKTVGLALINPVIQSGKLTYITENQIITDKKVIAKDWKTDANLVYLDDITFNAISVTGSGSILAYNKIVLKKTNWAAGFVVIGEGASASVECSSASSLISVNLVGAKSSLFHRSLNPLCITDTILSRSNYIASTGPLTVTNSKLSSTNQYQVKVEEYAVNGSYVFSGNSFTTSSGITIGFQKNPEQFSITYESNSFKNLTTAIESAIAGFTVRDNSFEEVDTFVQFKGGVISTDLVFDFIGNNVTKSLNGIKFGHEFDAANVYKRITVERNTFVKCDCQSSGALVDIDAYVSKEAEININENKYINNVCIDSEVRLFLQPRSNNDEVKATISKNVFKSPKLPASIPDEITVLQHNVFPTGLAWEPESEMFIVGSHQGEILSVETDGTITTVVADPRIANVPVRKVLYLPKSQQIAGLASNTTYAAIIRVSVEDWSVSDLIELKQYLGDLNVMNFFDFAVDADDNLYTIQAQIGVIVKLSESNVTLLYPEYPEESDSQHEFNGITVLEGDQLAILRGNQILLYNAESDGIAKNAFIGYNTITGASSIDARDKSTVAISSSERNRIWIFSFEGLVGSPVSTVSSARGSPVVTAFVDNVVVILNTEEKTFDGQYTDRFYITKACAPVNVNGPKDPTPDSAIVRPSTILRPRSAVYNPLLGFLVSSESTGVINVVADGVVIPYLNQFEGNRTLALEYNSATKLFYVTYTSPDSKKAFIALIHLEERVVDRIIELSAVVPQGYVESFNPVALTFSDSLVYVADSTGGWIWRVDGSDNVSILYHNASMLASQNSEDDGITGLAYFDGSLFITRYGSSGLIQLGLDDLSYNVVEYDLENPRAILAYENSLLVADDNKVIQIVEGITTVTTATMYTAPSGILLDDRNRVFLIYSQITENNRDFFIEKVASPLNSEGIRFVSIREKNLYPSGLSCPVYSGVFIPSLSTGSIYELNDQGGLQIFVNASEISNLKPIQLNVNVNMAEMAVILVNEVNCRACAPKLLKKSLFYNQMDVIDLYQLSNRAMTNAYAIAYNYEVYYISEPFTGTIWTLSRNVLSVLARDSRLGDPKTFGVTAMKYIDGVLLVATSKGQFFNVRRNSVKLISIDNRSSLDPLSSSSVTSLAWANYNQDRIAVAAIIGTVTKIFILGTVDSWSSAYVEEVLPSLYDQQLAICFDGSNKIYAAPKYLERYLSQKDTEKFQVFVVKDRSQEEFARSITEAVDEEPSVAAKSSITISIQYPIHTQVNIQQNVLTNKRAEFELVVANCPAVVNASLNYWGGKSVTKRLSSYFANLEYSPFFVTSNVDDFSSSNLVYVNTGASETPYISEPIPDETVEESALPVESVFPSLPFISSIMASPSDPSQSIATDTTSEKDLDKTKFAPWKTILIVIGSVSAVGIAVIIGAAIVYAIQYSRKQRTIESFQKLDTPLNDL